MHKYPNFIGQPIFSQLLNLLDKEEIKKIVASRKSDRYTKKFRTYEHLVTMLYCIFHKCSSLREVTTGMQVCQAKINHLGLNYCPRRSTISDANKRRSHEVFQDIYYGLYKKLGKSLSDSPNASGRPKGLYIVDSTTISLFKEILKNTGKTPQNGKRKGGMKVHALINSSKDVPEVVRMTSGAASDVPFIQKMNLPPGSVIVFDKGYIDYAQYDLWTKQQITWVTRPRDAMISEDLAINAVTQEELKKGVRSDRTVMIGHKTHKNITRTKARLVEYFDQETNRNLVFMTNNLKLTAYEISQIYKQRWQIELLFKRIKQNYPLQYFLGDNVNALKTQVWCVLIADLLLNFIRSITKRKWSFANLASMVRIHLMTYTKLLHFLENPEQALYKPPKFALDEQLKLFDSA